MEELLLSFDLTCCDEGNTACRHRSDWLRRQRSDNPGPHARAYVGTTPGLMI
jgi:hypothetical protein